MLLLLFLIFTLLVPTVSWSQALDRAHINYVNPLDYGTGCNSTSLNAAITAIGSNKTTLYLTKTDRAKAACTWIITANTTLHVNTTLWVPQGVVVSGSSSITVTVPGPLLSDNSTWYSGGIHVVNTYVQPKPGDIYVTDYGAKCDASTDDAIPLQAALTAATKGSTVVFPNGKCHTSVQLEFTKQGVNIRGQGVSFRNSGDIAKGSWLVLTATATSLFHTEFLVHSTISDIGFDGGGFAADVLWLESVTGPVFELTLRNIIVERPVFTTGHNIKLGGSSNLEVAWVTITDSTLYGDSTNLSNKAHSLIFIQNSNTQQNIIKNSQLFGATYGIYHSGSTPNINIQHNQFSGITTAGVYNPIYGEISGNYTEDINMTYFILQTDQTLAVPPPFRISRNILNMGVAKTPLYLFACQPILVESNQFINQSVLTLGAGGGTCGDYRLTAINNQWALGTLLTCGDGFTGTGAGVVDEFNSYYFNTSTTTTVPCSRFTGTGLKIGGGPTVTLVNTAVSAQTIAAPSTVPGCTDSANITLVGAQFSAIQPINVVMVNLQDKVLPAGGQLTAYTTGVGTVKVRWCQFTGAAVSPDAGATGNYVVGVIVTTP